MGMNKRKTWELNGDALIIYRNTGVKDYCRENNLRVAEFNMKVVVHETVADCRFLFSGCKSLTITPELHPNIKVCSHMFKCCYSLKDVPEIPSGASYCNTMFADCHGLVTAPTIPEGAVDCSRMFLGCSNLKYGTDIPASAKTASGIYRHCRNLVNTICNKSKVNLSMADFLCTPGLYSDTLKCYASSGVQFEAIRADLINSDNLVLVQDNNSVKKWCKEHDVAIEEFNLPVVFMPGIVDCSNLLEGASKFNQEVTIPTSVTNVTRMFAGCEQLQRVNTYCNHWEKYEGAFTGCYSLDPSIDHSVINVFECSDQMVKEICGDLEGKIALYTKDDYKCLADVTRSAELLSQITGIDITYINVNIDYYRECNRFDIFGATYYEDYRHGAVITPLYTNEQMFSYFKSWVLNGITAGDLSYSSMAAEVVKGSVDIKTALRKFKEYLNSDDAFKAYLTDVKNTDLTSQMRNWSNIILSLELASLTAEEYLEPLKPQKVAADGYNVSALLYDIANQPAFNAIEYLLDYEYFKETPDVFYTNLNITPKCEVSDEVIRAIGELHYRAKQKLEAAIATGYPTNGPTVSTFKIPDHCKTLLDLMDDPRGKTKLFQ